MPIESRWKARIPLESLQKWVFGSSFGPLGQHTVFADVDKPDTHFLTFSDYRLLSKRIALGLQRAGLQPGDRVLLVTSNNIYFPAIFFGVLMGGGIFSGASPLLTPRELAHQLRDCDAKFLLANTAVMEKALEAAAQCGHPRSNVYAFDDSLGGPPPGLHLPKDVTHWTRFLASNDDGEAFDWVEPADPRKVTCCLNYSSGTTGFPKGVEISHFSYVANGVGSSIFVDTPLKEQGEVDASEAISVICYLPLYHAAAQTGFVVNAPRRGTKTYIMPAFDLAKFLRAVERYRIKLLFLVPPVAVLLAKSPLVKSYDLSSVEEIGCGTAPLAADTGQAVERLWKDKVVNLRQAWGMTELTCVGSGWDFSEPNVPGSVGEVTTNAAIMLVDPQGNEITTANIRGELWFSGPTLMKGYWRNPKATRETLVEKDGRTWLRTGDIAYVDHYGPGGKIFVVDRVKELIKVKGNQVAPAELEAVLLEHPDIADVGVVGVVINGEEVPRAYVVRVGGSSVTESDVIKWMETRVARFKRLKGGVAFVEAIPKLPSGKIIRRALRDMAKNEVGDKQPRTSKLA